MQFELAPTSLTSEQIRSTYLRALGRAREGLRMELVGGDKTPAAIAAYSEAVALCDDVLDTLRWSEIPEREEEATKVQTLRDSYKAVVDSLSWLEQVQPGYVAPPLKRSLSPKKLTYDERPQPQSRSQSPRSPRFPQFDVEKALSA
ncbi:hypothetical protein FS749_012874 [Ceratobasidium sp. UAMH 11750]|nr:hypothetical protein FS749_012874 [Ceratobasidium sp. UAMH 11750]